MDNNHSKVDRQKWRPLIALGFAIFFAAILFYTESFLLRGILHGYTKDLPQAVFQGVILVILLPGIVVGLWRWWRRPRGEEAIMQAAAQVAAILPDTRRVFRPRKQARPSKVIYAALPMAFLAGSIFGLIINNWVMFYAFLGLAVFLTGLFWYVFNEREKTNAMVLTFDPLRKVVVFENFDFATAFLPQKPRPREEVPFEQILDSTFYPGHNDGLHTVRVRTSRGPTVISGDMEDFDAIRVLLESLVTLNEADPEQHQANLRSEPKVKIPWYGWLIFLAVFVGLGFLIWFLLTKL